ncbi:hypothetical protein IG631_21526 [Alternaria alternata]|nr:hypothetical protein IG631_21526 [Alternaria alternata]
MLAAGSTLRRLACGGGGGGDGGVEGGGSSVVTMGARRCFEDQPAAVDRSV